MDEAVKNEEEIKKLVELYFKYIVDSEVWKKERNKLLLDIWFLIALGCSAVLFILALVMD